MDNQLLALRGRVVTPNSIITDGAVVIAGDALVWVGEATAAAGAGFEKEILAAAPPTDENFIIPGLIDVHCHGGAGVSFPDVHDEAGAMTAVLEHRHHGTTSVVTSLVTASPLILRERAEMLAGLADKGEICGIHFEGPFIAHGHCGAQNPVAIQTPNPALARELLICSRSHAVSMTVAPERPYATGPGGVVETLIEGGALPSFGHTDSNAGTMREALRETRDILARNPLRRSGQASITHLFNGMAPVHHRDPGPVLEILADAASGGVIVELINDGVHIDPDIARSVFELIGRDQVMLITDAMAATGMADGQYVLGSLEVQVRQGQARLASGSLAGGTAHLLDVVRCSAKGGVPLVDAVYSATVTPARFLGDDTIGSLEAGKRADLVIVSQDLEVVRVMRKGLWI